MPDEKTCVLMRTKRPRSYQLRGPQPTQPAVAVLLLMVAPSTTAAAPNPPETLVPEDDPQPVSPIPGNEQPDLSQVIQGDRSIDRSLYNANCAEPGIVHNHSSRVLEIIGDGDDGNSYIFDLHPNQSSTRYLCDTDWFKARDHYYKVHHATGGSQTYDPWWWYRLYGSGPWWRSMIANCYTANEQYAKVECFIHAVHH